MTPIETNTDWEAKIIGKVEQAAITWGEVAKLGISTGNAAIARAGSRDAARTAEALIELKKAVAARTAHPTCEGCGESTEGETVYDVDDAPHCLDCYAKSFGYESIEDATD